MYSICMTLCVLNYVTLDPAACELSLFGPHRFGIVLAACPGEIGPGRAAGCHHAHLQHAGLSPGVPSAPTAMDP